MKNHLPLNLYAGIFLILSCLSFRSSSLQSTNQSIPLPSLCLEGARRQEQIWKEEGERNKTGSITPILLFFPPSSQPQAMDQLG